MRKYCRACGASLIKIDEPEPEPVPEPEPEPIAGAPVDSEDAPLVRPSEFAAKSVEETREPGATGVILEDVEEAEAAEEADLAKDVKISTSEVLDYDEGREVVKDILAKVKAAEERAFVEEPAPEPEVIEAVEEEELLEEDIPEPPAVEEPAYEPEDEEVEEAYEEAPAPPPEPEPAFTAVAPTPPVAEPADEISRDEKVRSLEADIKAFNIELQGLQAELDKLRSSLDGEVDRCHTVAETKRTRFETAEREMRLAKKE
jgi:DNA polymerase-3 subunit gamma/tau